MVSSIIIDYLNQSPIIPVVFTILLTIIVLMQCFTKGRFLKLKLLSSFLLTFISALGLVFYNDIIKNEMYFNILVIANVIIEVLVFILIFTTIDFSLSNEKLQRELTRSLDETKYYCLLDRKDRIKEISKRLVLDMGLERRDCINKSIFDVIENKYLIIGLNGADINKKDLKKYYDTYYKKASEGEVNPFELLVEDDNGKTSAIYFNETTVFSSGRYKGRILLGEIKNEDSLMGLEKDLKVASDELDIIKSRFITILNKTSDGIYFNNLKDRTIWFNDNLVRKLSLNGNSISTTEFLRNIHPDDLPLYEDIMTSNKGKDYKVTYRYNTGAYYVFVKEEGHKITLDRQSELCGVMNVIDDYSYEKTDTILDTTLNEIDLQVKYKELCSDEAIFEVVHFKVDSIPMINEKYGRAIGNMMLGHYISFFKEKFIENNYLFRVSGLEFVALITNYNKMQTLKNYLNSDERILHLSADYAGQNIDLEVFMGLSLSNDTPNNKDTIDNAKYALRVASNPQFKSNYVFFRDIK